MVREMLHPDEAPGKSEAEGAGDIDVDINVDGIMKFMTLIRNEYAQLASRAPD